MIKLRGLIAILIVGLFGAAGQLPALASGPQYITFSDPKAGTGQFQGTVTHGINPQGDIVGGYLDSNYCVHAFFLPHSAYTTGYTTIDDPHAPACAPFDSAMGIDARGEIAGVYYDSNFLPHGWLYSRGAYTPLSDPLAVNGTQPFSMNPEGDIVGYYLDATCNEHGFLLHAGVYTRIDDPNAVYSPTACTSNNSFGTIAYGINPQGEIVGYYYDSNGGGHGFLWRAGTFTPIDDPSAGPFGTYPNSINAQGDITGGYLDSNNIVNGFIWSKGTLTPFREPDAGPGGTSPYAITANGSILGAYEDTNSVSHGFMRVNK